MRVLYIGEIVGSSGIYCVKTLLSAIKKERGIDFVIASADGATGGFGVGKNHSIYLRKLGIAILTSGECIYYKRDMVPHLVRASYILRAANYPVGNPGRGWAICKANGQKIAVINLLGQSGFNRVHLHNPFLLLPDLVDKISRETNTIVVDFHASTTAEKNTMFYQMDGKVSAVLGSHTKTLSADERILPGGTAMITSTGRTGSINSVGGLDPEIEIRKFLTQVHELSKISWEELELQGVILEIDQNGKAVGIERIRVGCKRKNQDRGGKSPGN